MGFQKAMGLGNNFILALINNCAGQWALKGKILGPWHKSLGADVKVYPIGGKILRLRHAVAGKYKKQKTNIK